MTRTSPFTVATVLAAGLIASCTTTGTNYASPTDDEQVAAATADYGTHPKDYETIVKTWFFESLKDPYSVQYREITAPAMDNMVKQEPYRTALGQTRFRAHRVYGYSVCVTLMAKNSYGAYTGWKWYKVLIRDGRVVDHVSGDTVNRLAARMGAGPVGCRAAPPTEE